MHETQNTRSTASVDAVKQEVLEPDFGFPWFRRLSEERVSEFRVFGLGFRGYKP